MSWTALIPLKQRAVRKTRLSAQLDQSDRLELADALARHVVECLSRVSGVTEIVQLSPEPPTDARCAWRRDCGRGLNEELQAACAERGGAHLAIIHGDLPLLRAADIEALLEAAIVGGVAIAPDRHERGTNALALSAVGGFRFAFGENSLARHLQCAGPGARLVRRPGLAIDLDTPRDLDVARSSGWRWTQTSRL